MNILNEEQLLESIIDIDMEQGDEISITEEENKEETDNKNKEYMRNYMKKRYDENKKGERRRRNTVNLKKKYELQDKYIDKYGDFIYNIIKAKELLMELDNGLFNQFLIDYNDIEVVEK